MAAQILLVEDDEALGQFLAQALRLDGYQVTVAVSGLDCLESLEHAEPELILLDLGLPGRDGEEVLAELCAAGRQAAVLVVTGREDLEARIRCLDAGADDFLSKPFRLHELRARCRALLRRGREAGMAVTLRAADIELDRVQRRACRAGRPLRLTNKEFALLEQLMLARGGCVSRAELLRDVWRMEAAEAAGQLTNIVDVYVNYLRRKLGEPASGGILLTVRGQGYRLCADVPRTAAGPGALAPAGLA